MARKEDEGATAHAGETRTRAPPRTPGSEDEGEAGRIERRTRELPHAPKPRTRARMAGDEDEGATARAGETRMRAPPRVPEKRASKFGRAHGAVGERGWRRGSGGRVASTAGDKEVGRWWRMRPGIEEAA